MARVSESTGWRSVAATISAVATGVVNIVVHREPRGPALGPGDPAPDFALPGSDGRSYRLAEMTGSTVVLAWFPKAFTGG